MMLGGKNPDIRTSTDHNNPFTNHYQQQHIIKFWKNAY